jgi:hypothetical protein
LLADATIGPLSAGSGRYITALLANLDISINRSKMKTWAFGAAVALVPVGYMTACSYESHRGEAAMAQVQKGNSEEKVVALFGPPNTREH